MTVLATAWDADLGPSAAGTDYPLVAPSSDIAHILADFSFAFAQGTLAAAPPLHLARLQGFDAAFAGGLGPHSGSHTADCVIADHTGATIFDTASGSYAGIPWGDHYYLHEWIGAAAVCRAVQRTAFPTAADVRTIASDFVPAAAVLDERTLDCWNHRLTSFNAATNLVTLRSGYNLVFAAEPPVLRNGRRTTVLTITAQTGQGAGRVPPAELPGAGDPLVIRTLGGQAPDAHGQFQLATDSCLWTRPVAAITSHAPRLVTLAAGALKLGDDCKSCCDCPDYAGMALAQNTLWNRLVKLAGQAEAARDLYESLWTRWMEAKRCREERWVKVQTVSHDLQSIEVSAQFCNHREHCLDNVTLDFDIVTTPPTDWALAEESAYATTGSGGLAAAAMTTTGDGLSYTWSQVAPRAHAAIRFRLLLGVIPVTVLLIARARVGNEVLPHQVQTTLTLPL